MKQYRQFVAEIKTDPNGYVTWFPGDEPELIPRVGWIKPNGQIIGNSSGIGGHEDVQEHLG